MVPDRATVSIALLGLLIVTAGCLGSPSETTPTPTAVPTTVPSDGSPAATTDTPVGTADLPYDLRLRNYGDSATTVQVTVTYDGTGERIFSEEVTLDPGERADYDLSFMDAGNYTVEATANGSTDEYVWELGRVPPSHELIVTAEDDEVTFVRSAA